jgi:hypothetical protein
MSDKPVETIARNTISVSLPLFVTIPRKTKEDKKVTLSLNVIRNLHHFSMNAIKAIVHKMVTSQLSAYGKVPILTPPIRVTVRLWLPDRANKDLANFAPVAQKFADDAVVEFGCMKDDNVKYITECFYVFMGIDKTYPRFEITYNTIKPQEGQ